MMKSRAAREAGHEIVGRIRGRPDCAGAGAIIIGTALKGKQYLIRRKEAWRGPKCC
jgi:hypothetical protein